MRSIRGGLRYMGLAVTAILSACAAQGDGKSEVGIDAKVTRVRYCSERGADISAHLYLALEYSSRATVPVLVPMFARVSSYSVFADMDQYRRGQVEDHVTFRKPHEDELPDLVPSPSPTLFSILPVGGKLRRDVVIRIPVGAGKHMIRLGTDRVIDIEVDHWPRSPEIGLRLRKEWKDRGDLLMSKVKISNPIKIHIDKNPVPSPCWMQVD